MSIESTTSILVQNCRAQNERNLPCPSRSFISCSSSACFPSMKFFRIFVYKQVYCCKERNPRRCNRIPRAPNQRWHYVGKRNSVLSINHPPCLWLAHFQAHSIGPDLHSGLLGPLLKERSCCYQVNGPEKNRGEQAPVACSVAVSQKQ